jgi:hypothetical protein
MLHIPSARAEGMRSEAPLQLPISPEPCMKVRPPLRHQVTLVALVYSTAM